MYCRRADMQRLFGDGGYGSLRLRLRFRQRPRLAASGHGMSISGGECIQPLVDDRCSIEFHLPVYWRRKEERGFHL